MTSSNNKVMAAEEEISAIAARRRPPNRNHHRLLHPQIIIVVRNPPPDRAKASATWSSCMKVASHRWAAASNGPSSTSSRLTITRHPVISLPISVPGRGSDMSNNRNQPPLLPLPPPPPCPARRQLSLCADATPISCANSAETKCIL